MIYFLKTWWHEKPIVYLKIMFENGYVNGYVRKLNAYF